MKVQVKTVLAVVVPGMLAILLVAAGCSRCETTDDAAEIRKLIAAGAARAENHDIRGLLALATEDLAVMPGNRNRDQVARGLFAAFRFYGNFAIRYPRPQVDVGNRGVSARASFPFLVVQNKAALPEITGLYEDPEKFVQSVGKLADLYRLELVLQKAGGTWRVQKARITHGAAPSPWPVPRSPTDASKGTEKSHGSPRDHLHASKIMKKLA